jgi:ribonuclease BN (tRNA processing enzyme)
MTPVATKQPKRVDYNFYTFDNGIYRVSGPESSLCAYLVETSAGLVQVNTVPELFKTYFPHLKKLPVAACLTTPVITQMGDTQTGYEFELWTSRFVDFMNPHRLKFIGHEAFLKSLYSRLKITMNGDFVRDEGGNVQAKYVDRVWVDDVFEWAPTSEKTVIGKVTIDSSNPDGVKIFDGGKLVFDSAIYPISNGKDSAALYVDTMLSQLNPFKFNPEHIGLTVGGNGIGTKPGVTSNFIVYYGDRMMWIDPPARFFEKSVRLGIHPDEVTDFVITHCHEDHIEGFSALLQRKIERQEKIRLLSIDSVYAQLKEIFNPLFGDIAPHITYSNLHDRTAFSNYHGCDIEIRENYHPIPTIGMKFTFNGRTIAISGDSLYTKDIINARLNSGAIDKAEYERQSSAWFANAEYFLHDTTVAGDPVHTDLEDVEDLAKEIPHVKCYAYHFGLRFENETVTATTIGDRL